MGSFLNSPHPLPSPEYWRGEKDFLSANKLHEEIRGVNIDFMIL